MKKTQLILVSLFALAVFTCTSGVASAIYVSPKYVGNTMVDLSWTQYESTDFSKYELCRDGVPITTITDRTVTFYRDAGLTKGNTYGYGISVYDASGVLKATIATSATTGEVRGTITIDTTWTAASSPYTLTGDVDVRNGATLTIGSGVVIVSEPHKDISVEEKGVLYADGASFYDVLIKVHNYTSIKNCFFEHAGINLHNLNNSIIAGNTVNGSRIYLSSSSNNSITDNTISKSIGGIYLSSSSNNIVTNNTISKSAYGIYLSSSSNNIVTNNTLPNTSNGIILSKSSNNAITYNTVSNNSRHGIYLNPSSNNNVITDNIVSKSVGGICLYRSSNNNVITDNTLSNNDYGIFLDSSSNNIVTDNTLSNNNFGIDLSSSNNIVTDNTVSNNYHGISLAFSSNNSITDNTVSNNSQHGISLAFSSNNTLYNNYFNNTNNAYDNGNNTWNITKIAGTNIVGGPYLGGNYWGDYDGADLDADKLGDTLLPYNCSGRIENGGDYHPLIIIPKIILKASKDGYASVQHEIDNDENFERIDISGIVFDKKTGELIEGAKVEIIKGANHAATTTNAYGNYSITAIMPDGSGSDTREDVHFELPPAEFIVGVYEITSEVLDLIEDNNGTVIDQTPNENWPQALLVNISEEKDIEGFIENVNNSSLVQYVELNDIIKVAYIPNDYRYLEQWGPQNIWAAGPLDPSAWDVERGNRSVRIAIIDTGIQFDHRDLHRFTDGSIKYVYGYDWVDIDNDPSPVVPQEDHGTHCAGIATAVMDNYEGIAGIAPNCSLIAERVLGVVFIPVPLPGHWEDRGDEWSIGFGIMDAADHDADVISMSLGSPNPHWFERFACQYASNQGSILVAASGNDANLAGYAGGICFPAAYPWVIAVGATNQSNLIADFSQRGPELELVAPGVDILSTVFRDDYTTMSGTSMATPHVAGVAALVKSRSERWPPEPLAPNPNYNLSSNQIRQVLIQTADDLGPPGWDQEYGHGKVDAARAIRCVNISGNVLETLNNAPILQPPDVPSPPMVNVTSIEGPPGNFTTNENTLLARITRNGDYYVRVPPGVYSICAMAYGYNSSRGLGGERVELPAFDLVGRLNEKHMNFSLDPFRCNVTGIVNDSETGLPINNANVSLGGPPLITPPHSNVRMDTKTDSTGKYSFILEYSVHPPYPTDEAVYNITVSKKGYQNQTKNFTLNWGNVVTDYYKCPLDPNDYNPPIVNFSLRSEEAGIQNDVIVGAPHEDVRGSTDQGQVYRFYGLTGELRHTIDCPSNHSNALFGNSVSSGMVGSDYCGEIIVGAPGEGRVYTFYGATSKLHHTIDCPSSQPGALFGNSVGAGDVNGDGFDEIIVGAPGEGRVYTFYGLTGELHHTIDCPSSQPGALFGNSVGAGDVNGDGFDEIIVGAPSEDVGGDESQGRVYTFYGLTGELHHTIDCPNPQPGVLFGHSVNTDDLVSDYREEVIVGAPGEDVGGKKDQGRGYTFYGATSKLHVPLNCTSSQPDALFGHSLSAGDMSGDGLNEVIVGAPGEGRVYTFYGLTGKLRHTIDCPNPQPDASFGYSVSAGTVGSDYRDEVIVGTPGEDIGGNESQGRVYTFYGATSKLRHTIDTPNPQPDASFGYSVCVIGGFMGVTCSDSRVNIDHTQTSVTDDPVGEGYDVSNAPAGVNLAYAKGFNIVATGPDGSYPFDVTFSSPIIESSVLHKLPAWTEAPHTMIGPNTIQVQLDIIEGVLDPPFILAPVEGVPLPDLTLTSDDIRFIPTASTSISSYSSGQTTLTKDIHKPKSAPNILKNVKSAQPYKEIISREVMSSSDTPTFTIENLTYPPIVDPDQTFQVTVDTNYSFNATTDIFVGIWDYDAWDYIAETPDDETLSGTGSKSYTFNLTAPPSGIMDLSADACCGDYDVVYYRDFEVIISAQSFTIENLTYPPTVDPNQTFQVTVHTNYSFENITYIYVGIWDYDASEYIAGTPIPETTLSGSGNISYTLNLTAPLSGIMNLSADLCYWDDEWNLSDYSDFDVNISAEEPNFTIAAIPSSRTVSQGDSAPYTISLTALNGFNSPVTLSVSGLPTGATGIFNPSPVTPSDSSTLTINTSMTTPTGNYTLTITGVGGEITHQTTVALNITATVEENVTTISATIHNIGTANASDVTVQFFDGDPGAGGIQIGNDQTITSIPAGGAEMVSADWTPGAYACAIYVWVDPFDSIQESNEENNIVFNTILLEINGDLNNDGALTPADAVIALEIAAGAGSHPLDPATLATVDVSGDGRVTSLDALMILQAAAGNIEL